VCTVRRALCSLTALVVFVASGCRSGNRAPAPQAPLERGIYFAERDRNDELHPLSQHSVPADATTRAVERIPRGDLVDYESNIDIVILRDELLPVAERVALPEDVAAIAKRASQYRRLLEQIAPYAEARADLVRAFELDDAAYEDALERYRQAEKPIIDLFRNPDESERLALSDSDAQDRLEALVIDFMASSGDADQRLTRSLQDEVDSLERAVQDSVAAAKENGIRLRIEAFLIPNRGEQPTALSLPGYNNIEARQTESIDRFGLALGPSDAERLRALLREAHKLSDALGRVKDGTASLEEALSDSSSRIARELRAIVADVETLRSDLQPASLEVRLDSTRVALDAFVVGVQSGLARELGGALAEERDALLSLVEGLDARSQALADLLQVLEQLPEVRDLWRDVSVEELPAAIATSLDLVGSIREVAQGPEALIDVLADGLRELDARAREWPEVTDTSIRRAIETAYRDSELATDVAGWRELAARLSETVERVASLFPSSGGSSWSPIDLMVQAPDTIDVPLEDAADTAITLKGSAASPGDTIEVRTTLIGARGETAHGHAMFEVAKLGWHAEFHPAVVLITADKLAGRPDDGGFSASLAWMLERTPRRDEDGFWPDFARVTQWSVGLHAVLLNFDPDNDAEIGLGITAGLWEGKLLFGAGYNMAADSEEEGRYYYYIGSSLIALLQTLQSGVD
jgi:hypothetical protein